MQPATLFSFPPNQTAPHPWPLGNPPLSKESGAASYRYSSPTWMPDQELAEAAWTPGRRRGGPDPLHVVTPGWSRAPPSSPSHCCASFLPARTHGHGHDFSPVKEEGYRSTPYQNLSSSEREQSYMPHTHTSSIN
jgi:hypothetical protein